MSTQENYTLTVTSPATTGLVAAVTGFLAENHCYITEMAQFDDESTKKFFCRISFRRTEQAKESIDEIREKFTGVADHFQLQWKIVDSNRPMRVILMVSKADHCLTDLLYRKNKGDLNMDVLAVIANHQDMRPMAEREGIRFVHLPVTPENKPEQEARLLELVDELDAELVVLARYMQVLSDDTCRKLRGKCINIHHSFLPGFKGARPYHQAFDRGVKLIGATAHYVTSDLDEGPIIEQAVERVDHTYLPNDLVAMGRDLENQALAKAVRLHIQHRVFMDGNKTVVFK
ncbi:MAG: formyltetrahydrofolate deformylase [Thiolinea sp.]